MRPEAERLYCLLDVFIQQYQLTLSIACAKLWLISTLVQAFKSKHVCEQAYRAAKMFNSASEKPNFLG